MQAITAAPPDGVVTLDHGGAPQSPNYVRAPGEYSFVGGPSNFYAFSPAKVGEPAPLESVTLRFAEPTTITKIESASADFEVENGGTCAAGQSLGKGDSCIALIRFAPQGAGRRLGRLSVSHTASPEPASIGLGGFGYAPVISFVPSRTYTLATTYASPNGVLKSAPNLTVDGGDTLYIADVGNSLLRKIDSSGTLTNTTPFFSNPISVAVDTFGIVWGLGPSGSSYYFLLFEPWSTQGADSATYVSSTCTPSAPCSLGSFGMSNPAEISIDSDNNLFMEEGTQGALEMPIGGYSGGNGTLDLWHLLDQYAYFTGTPSTFAVNIDDDLFTALEYPFENTCYLLEEPVYGAEIGNPTTTRVAGGSKCGYSGDGGLGGNAEIGAAVGQIAFDAAGDLYFTDTNNQRVRMINARTGMISTVLGTGTDAFAVATGNRSTIIPLSNPTGLAVDSQGQIYVISEAPANAATQVIQQVTTTGILNFSNQTQGTTSPATMLTLTNTGNSTMSLTSYNINGANTGDFSIDPKTTNCVLTAGATMASGQTCKIGILFKPSGTGVRSANLVFLDNTVNGSNTVNLYGIGTAPAPAFVPGSVRFPATTPTQSNTMPVTITNHGNVDLQMANIALGGSDAGMFSFTSNCLGGSIAPGASCTLNVAFKPSSTGSYSASLSFTDNAPNSPQTVFVSGSGQKPYTSATKLTSAANPAPACSAVTFHVTVSTSDGSAATGPVSLQAGALTLASGTLTNGSAILSAEGLAPGLNLITSTYGGDTEHAGSATTLSQMVNRGSCRTFHPPLPALAAPVHDAPIPDRP